jgi:hypothetical protein
MTASGEHLDELAHLEERRRFLLRSLDDLERELAAGDIDQRDYDILKADYTSRAAEVIRRIEGGAEQIAEQASSKREGATIWRRPLVWLGVIALAAGCGVLVARYAGERKAGQSLTGGVSMMDPTQARVAELLQRAREELGSDPLNAIQDYDQVVKLDPTIAEAWAYGGWQLRLVAIAAPDDQKGELLNGAERRLVKATEVDPTYPDPKAFLAVMALRDFNDPAGARKWLEELDQLPSNPQIVSLTASIRTELKLPAVTTTAPVTTTP